MNKILSTKVFILSQIIILIFIGLFTGGLYYILNSDQYTSSAIKNYLPVTSRSLSYVLDISTPDDEVLVFDKSLIITGKTNSKSNIVISSSEGASIGIQTDSNGDFSKIIELSKGLNRITVVGFDLNGNTKTLTRDVYFSEEKI